MINDDCGQQLCKANVCSLAQPLTLAFARPVVVALADTYAANVTVGDFDGDGNTDIAVAENAGGVVDALLGKGDGSFRAPARFPSGGSSSLTATVSDFDGDGHGDMAVLFDSSRDIRVLFGDKNGLGGGMTVLRLASGPTGSIVSGDFDGDGRIDLATSGAAFFGDGKRGFVLNGGVTPGGPRLAADGVEKNGRADLLSQDGVWLSSGQGRQFRRSWANADWPRNPLDPSIPQDAWLSTPDLNGDLLPDLVWTLRGQLFALLSDGKGAFGRKTRFVSVMSPGAMTAGDFNADGWADVVLVDEDARGLVFSAGDGAGALRAGGALTPGIITGTPVSLASADFNRDGKLDLAMTVFNGLSPMQVAILLNTSR